LRELNKVYSELLLIDRHTAKTRQELVRIRERIVSIPNEKSDLRTQHLRIVSEMRRLEEALRPISENATAAEQALRKAVSDWELREASLQAEIKSKEREKAAVERHFAMLEAAKINPYLRIGEVLAGSGIAPLNQPESLANVRRLQVQVALLEGAIVDSRAASQAADGRELRASMVLCISIACVVLLILAIALAHG